MATTKKTTRQTELKAKPRAARRDPLADALPGSGHGGYAAAREGFQAALQIRRETGDRHGEADSLHQLAVIDMKQRDFAAAREGFQAALQIRREIGDRHGEADSLYQIAKIDLIQGPDPREARERTIRELAVEYLQHPDEWLDHPHPLFDGRTPNEMIAAGREDMVRNLFFCYSHGMF